MFEMGQDYVMSFDNLKSVFDEDFRLETKIKMRKEFEVLKSSAERMSFSMKYVKDKLRDNFDGFKNLIKCEYLRQKGNEAFKIKNYSSALLYFTKSIALAPHPGCKQESGGNGRKDLEVDSALSFAVANRSAVLFEMKKYECCLRDITLALSLNYPSELLFKLYARKMKCLEALGKVDEIFMNLLPALESLSLADKLAEEKKELLKEEMEGIAFRARSLKSKPSDVSTVPIDLKISYGVNKSLQGCSDCIEMKTTSDMGRGLFTTRDIKIGDILLIETPFASVLKEDYFYKNCHHCFNKSSTLISCLYCSVAMFCSEECYKKAWTKYHEFECKLLPVLIRTKIYYKVTTALRSVLTARSMYKSLTDFYKQVKTFSAKHEESKEKLQDSNYFEMYNCITNSEKRPAEQLLLYSLHASLVTWLLETETDFFRQSRSDEETIEMKELENFISGLIMRHLQNQPFKICSYEFESNGIDYNVLGIGSGIYPVMNLVNHSCEPNVFHYTHHGNRIVIRALRNIKQGEQIFDSYGELYSELPRKERQRALLESYYFKCCCVACNENWPVEEILKFRDPVLKCQYCQHKLPDDFGMVISCRRCRRKTDVLQKNMEIKNAITDLTAKGKRGVKGGLTLSDITEVIELLNRNVCKPSYFLSRCEDYIADYFYQVDCYNYFNVV